MKWKIHRIKGKVRKLDQASKMVDWGNNQNPGDKRNKNRKLTTHTFTTCFCRSTIIHSITPHIPGLVVRMINLSTVR